MAEEDTLLLMLVTLFSDDRPNTFLSAQSRIKQNQEYFIQVMFKHMEQKKGTDCLMLLPLLRTLNTLFMEVLTQISVSLSFRMCKLCLLAYA